MRPDLESIQAALSSEGGASSLLAAVAAIDVAAAWARCEDGRVLLYVAVVAGERLGAVKAALACVLGASTYERLSCGPYPTVEEAIREVEAWLDDPDVDRREALDRHVREVLHWVKWTTGTACARAIADVVELTHAVATDQLRRVPALAASAVENAAAAMVEDTLRGEGAPEGAAVEARLRSKALAYLAQVVRELVACPALSGRELLARWIAGWTTAS